MHVITVLNGVLDNNFKYRGEPEHMEEQIRQLAKACASRTDRVYLTIGGKAGIYGYAPEWDTLVEKYVNIAREMGVTTSNAAHYYEAFKLHTDGTHFARESLEDMVKMDVEIFQALFIMTPSDAWLMRFATVLPELAKSCPL